MMVLLLSSGGAWMPSYMEGWFYTLPRGKTVPQDGDIRWGPVPVFCVWPAAPTRPSPSLPSGTVWWCNVQWPALCSGGISHNETYNKYVACHVLSTVVAVTSKWINWDHLDGQKQFFATMGKPCVWMWVGNQIQKWDILNSFVDDLYRLCCFDDMKHGNLIDLKCPFRLTA
jgi:hypothetical protein